MGYSTDFNGKFKLNKTLTPSLKEFLTKLNDTRRMGRNVSSNDFGVEGEFFVDGEGFKGQGNGSSVIDHNTPPKTQPGLWCQWIPTDDGNALEWDGGEKFYHYIEWLNYIIEKILKPNGYIVNGTVDWTGEDASDVGEMIVKNNKITIKEFDGKGKKAFKSEMDIKPDITYIDKPTEKKNPVSKVIKNSYTLKEVKELFEECGVDLEKNYHIIQIPSLAIQKWVADRIG